MKALIIHNGTGVDKQVQEELRVKLEKLTGKKGQVRTSRFDQVRAFFDDLPSSSEKVQILVFIGLDEEKIATAKAVTPQVETMYTIHFGFPLEDSPGLVHESALCLGSWNTEAFITFFHS